MANKLTLTEVKKINKKFDEKKRVELPDGNHVFIYPNFSKKDVMNLLGETFTEFAENQKAFKKINMTDWATFALLYKFADLGIPSVFSKKVLAFDELLRYDHYEDIISAYPAESIKLYEEMMKKFQHNMNTLIDSKEEGMLDKLQMRIEKMIEEEEKNEELQ
ncbi:hypothetical protein [Bacillus sp. Au-Bac7]|uniref:hypothetical protein n=1 Tax=Bacillus sp. Au-Bac7 TaxID=2906458 RepID=UPI001E4B84DA|nr:hypothetical protein [Bacillus sp. Au-Bac7]MCE4051900.1 hypothetical protein [Bacillus sp. Au-Bac7]